MKNGLDKEISSKALLDYVGNYVRPNEGFSPTAYYGASGVKHIGYGHTGGFGNLWNVDDGLSDVEDLFGITESQATVLLLEDLDKNYGELKRFLANNALYHGKFQKLGDKSKLMLLDYTFNLGIGREDPNTGKKTGLVAYPKLTKAILNNDWVEVSKEYKRNYSTPQGKVKELKKRNNDTFEYFIWPELQNLGYTR